MNSERLVNQFWEGQPFSVASNIFFRGEKFQAHRHDDYYEFFMVVEGELEHTLNGKNSRIGRRGMCLLYPDDEHELRNFPSSDKVNIINCTFSGNFLRDTERFLGYDLESPPDNWSGRVAMGIPAPLWVGMLNKANTLMFNHGDFSSDRLRALFRSLLLDTLLILSQPLPDIHGEAPGWLIRAREQMLLENNYIAGLPRFIALSGRTQEHLTRSMRKYYHESPTAFVNQLRSRKAAQ